jgi:hypothetical protein
MSQRRPAVPAAPADMNLSLRPEPVAIVDGDDDSKADRDGESAAPSGDDGNDDGIGERPQPRRYPRRALSLAEQQAAEVAAAEAAAAKDIEIAELRRQLLQAQQQAQPQQQHQQQQLQQHRKHSSSSADTAAAIAAAVAAAMAQMQQQQQAASIPAQVLLSSLGQLERFHGRASDANGLIARDWMAQAEHYFEDREGALGQSAAEGDKARVTTAVRALTEEGLRWWQSLPAANRPATWAMFKNAFLQRFGGVASKQAREAALELFVEPFTRLPAASKDRLTAQAIREYTARFLDLAAQVDSARMPDSAKLRLYAKGLPQRYAELVLTEDAKEPPLPLHKVTELVVTRALTKALAAAAAAGSSAAAAPAAPSGSTRTAGGTKAVDAVSLCMANLGYSRSEAEQLFVQDEGWPEHDTSDDSRRSPGPAGGSSAAEDRLVQRLLAAFGAQRTDSGTRPSAAPKGKKPPHNDRNVPRGVLADIPAELLAARKEAGLCAKCGVAKYEPGHHGHNARACKNDPDKTTSVEAGKRKAGF